MMGALLGTTACSGDKTGVAKNTGNEAGAAAGPAKFSYTLPGKFANWIKDMNWVPVLLKETGADIEFVNGGDGDPYYKNIDLKVGSGQFSDAGIVQLSQAEVYGSKGAFVDLLPLINQYGPNIKNSWRLTRNSAS